MSAGRRAAPPVGWSSLTLGPQRQRGSPCFTLLQCSIDFFTVDARDGAALARVVAAEAVLVLAVLVMAMRTAPDTAIPNARAVMPRPAPWLDC